MSGIPEPEQLWSGKAIDQGLRDHLQRLDDMFDDRGLEQLRSRHPNHPAVRDYDLLAALERGDAELRWPEESEAARAVGTLGLDFSSWAPTPPYVDFWSFLDGETRAWTVGALRKPDQFEDVMAELFVWGWLKSQRLDVHRVNEEGRSDIVVASGDESQCEVKRIHVGTAERRVAEVVKKANKQIKQSDPDGAGTLFLSLGRSPNRAAFDDRVPNDIEPYLEAARSAVKVHNSSVGRIVVMWDDVMILGDPPEPVLYAFRRRSAVIEHQAPRAAPTLSADVLNVGRTAVIGVRWHAGSDLGATRSPLRPVIEGDIAVTQLFREENEIPDGIRPQHAIEAFREPDARSHFDLGGIEAQLATRRITLGQAPYTLLLVASRALPDGEIQITAGFRLYRDEIDTIRLWEQPVAAFEALLERYALRLRLGEHIGLFIPAAIVEAGTGVEGENAPDVFLVHTFMRPLEDGRCEYAWTFGLDMGAYRSAARQHTS